MSPSPSDADSIPRISSAATISSPSGSSDPKKSNRVKGNEFTFKHGKRHHSYDADKAPYPLAYDADNLDMESMQLLLCNSIGIAVSFVPEINTGDKTPSRSLDVGCGQGLWVLHAAKEWPTTQFVGIDLVNIQVPLKFLDDSVARRVEWVHANFVTTRLPFEDDEFDHARICFIGRGVPENKWISILEEVHRVLEPGGVVEVVDSDIIFPTLPPWFTAALRANPQQIDPVYFPPRNRPSSPVSSASSITSTLPASPPPSPPHEHVLLESLFYSVFESRFINLRPTATMPGYFATVFTNVGIPPSRSFPDPPYKHAVEHNHAPSRSSETPEAGHSHTPISGSPKLAHQLLLGGNAGSSSLKSASLVSLYSASDSEGESDGSNASIADTFTWDESTDRQRLSTFTTPSPNLLNAGSDPVRRGDASSSTTAFDGASTSSGQRTSSTIYGYGDEDIVFTDYYNVDDRLMFMHLYISYQDVLACREPMWEELSHQLSRKVTSLKALGWEGDEKLDDPGGREAIAREKFEELFHRYCSDMQIRFSFGSSLVGKGWPVPVREPLTKAQRLEQERLSNALENALRGSSSKEPPRSCRVMRGLWGYKTF